MDRLILNNFTSPRFFNIGFESLATANNSPLSLYNPIDDI